MTHVCSSANAWMSHRLVLRSNLRWRSIVFVVRTGPCDECRSGAACSSCRGAVAKVHDEADHRVRDECLNSADRERVGSIDLASMGGYPPP
jgi:hypothetical protein